ncbi:MAG: binding-protein-dependent transport system inner rane component [Thermomicrobiales bacterium]|jgi:peptide/nickel transport system permease protein|nr:binding-protein-dependent transport system inner rane component [Thermomicrobiales bacterium]
MTATTLAPIAAPTTRWRRALVGGTAGKLGVLLLLMGGAVAILGPYVAPHSPTALVGLPLDSPSGEHWLGTDQLGRDVLSRVLYGGRSVLILATLAVIVTFIVGGPLGMLAGYRGGKLDVALSRVADVMMSIPPLILVLIFIFVVGSSNLSIVLLTGLVTAPRVFRIIRGATQAVAEQDFILAARARGEGTGAIIGRELLPNVTGPLLTEAAIRLNFSIMFIATLNFLGLGVQPPSSDWGLMVSEGRVYLGQAPLISVTPALAIAVLTIGINLVSDQIGVYLARNGSGHARL